MKRIQFYSLKSGRRLRKHGRSCAVDVCTVKIVAYDNRALSQIQK